ncbi:MAG: transcription elongation factor GreB [Alphaproteobacteria bacterium]|nr:transcription elongation factor GreB [Alphaproteobacteria bacterium]MDE2335686.1 transcription elongation factor GreB [Alphaproteobacteria bacterium]
MSKAFTTEDRETQEEPDDAAPEESLPAGVKNYMTPGGFAALQAELNHLYREERPKVVEIVSWAAGNGDRSENGDYLYGKKRLREIDRRLRYLTKRLESAEVVDPKKQQGLKKVFFGATVVYAREDGSEHVVTLVGPDEADVAKKKISWLSPVARALLKAQAGDEVTVRTAAGTETLEVISVNYPL